MSPALETAVIALGVNGIASTAALVYVVRRVSPWPKPPAQPGTQASGSSRRPGTSTGQTADPEAPAANGSDPARSTA